MALSADIQDVRIGAWLRSRLPPSCNTRSNTRCPSAPHSGKPRERIRQSSQSSVGITPIQSRLQPRAHDGPDGRIHSGGVPAARQYRDAFHFNRLSELI